MKIVEVSSNLATKLLGKYLCDLGWNICIFESEETYSPYPKEDWNTVKNKLKEGKREINNLDKLIMEVESANVLISDLKNVKSLLPGNDMSNIIYINLPAYASEDLEHSSFCTDEAAIMSASGVFNDMGLNRTLLGIRASFSHLPLASVYGSMFALCALLSCVVQGDVSRYVEVPLASALCEALVHNSIVYPTEDVYVSRRKQRIAQKRFPVNTETLDSLFDPFRCLWNVSFTIRIITTESM